MVSRPLNCSLKRFFGHNLCTLGAMSAVHVPQAVYRSNERMRRRKSRRCLTPCKLLRIEAKCHLGPATRLYLQVGFRCVCSTAQPAPLATCTLSTHAGRCATRVAAAEARGGKGVLREGRTRLPGLVESNQRSPWMELPTTSMVASLAVTARNAKRLSCRLHDCTRALTE
jgi:hypothetical protein